MLAAVLLLCGCSVQSPSPIMSPPDTDTDADLETSDTSDTSDTGLPPEGSCDGVLEGEPCGERRVCEQGTCVFTEPDTPCDVDFAAVPADAFLVIACDHDLGGATVQLAPGITLEHHGGSISNGTFVFDHTRINGQLLRLDLVIDGRNPSGLLIDPAFVFEPERWGMLQGDVDAAAALSNRENLNTAIQLVSKLSGRIFDIHTLDVFLDNATGSFIWRSLRLPSDFHLRMSDDTHLRVFSNDRPEYSLISTQETRNVTISGGHLHGDRFTHDYSSGGRHDQGIGVYLLGAQNVLVEGLSSDTMIGDGLLVGSSSLRNDDGSPNPGTQYGEDVTIRDCSFDQNRRNGLALTDVDGALLERLTIERTALDSTIPGAGGTSPRAAIQIEPIIRYVEGTQTLRLLEQVRNVVIRDSDFHGNDSSDITFHHCENTEVTENRFGGGTTSVSGAGVHLHHNIYVADRVDRERAIHVPRRIRDNGEEIISGWRIHDNQISGYEFGILIGGPDQQVYNNTIEDFRLGIYLGSGDLLIEDNHLSTTRPESKAISNVRGGSPSIVGVVRGGEASSVGQPLRLVDINQGPGTGQLLVEGIEFTSSSGEPAYVQDSDRITIQDCIADGFQLNGSPNVVLSNNTVR